MSTQRENLYKTLELKKQLKELQKINPEKALKILKQEVWKRQHRPMGIHGTNAARARKFKKPFCERCSATERLLVHHINRKQSDNRPENLETLCSKCHHEEHENMCRKAED